MMCSSLIGGIVLMEQTSSMNICKACTYYCDDCYSDDVGPQPYKKRTAKIDSELEGYWFGKKKKKFFSNTFFVGCKKNKIF